MKALAYGSGAYVPMSVAVCPECRGELMARSMQWDDGTGQPHAAAIEITCLSDPDLNHRYHQSDWQLVRDAIAKWCGAD